MKSQIELIIKDKSMKISSNLTQKELSLLINTLKIIDEDFEILDYHENDDLESIIETFECSISQLLGQLKYRGFEDLKYEIEVVPRKEIESIIIV